jgi:hypothetical protein
MGEPIILNDAEKRAIRTLHRLATSWPQSLWLFSASGTLCVMKAGPGGEHIHTADDGVDPDYVIDSIDIDNDGGDW